MNRRVLRLGLACLVVALVLAAPVLLYAKTPSAPYDEGIYGGSDYTTSQVNESANVPGADGYVDPGVQEPTPVPEPGTLVLLTLGFALGSREVMRRRAMS